MPSGTLKSARLSAEDRLRQLQTEFNEAIAAKMRTGLPRSRAICEVCRQQPSLRERLVAAANAVRHF